MNYFFFFLLPARLSDIICSRTSQRCVKVILNSMSLFEQLAVAGCSPALQTHWDHQRPADEASARRRVCVSVGFNICLSGIISVTFLKENMLSDDLDSGVFSQPDPCAIFGMVFIVHDRFLKMLLLCQAKCVCASASSSAAWSPLHTFC